MKPKLSHAAIQLREQIDDSFMDRDRASDGWLGDSRHSARKSDHNPDHDGWVRALDIDRDLIGKKGKPDLMPDLADQIRLAAKRGEKRIAYIIFEPRLISPWTVVRSWARSSLAYSVTLHLKSNERGRYLSHSRRHNYGFRWSGCVSTVLS